MYMVQGGEIGKLIPFPSALIFESPSAPMLESDPDSRKAQRGLWLVD